MPCDSVPSMAASAEVLTARFTVFFLRHVGLCPNWYVGV